jgi:NAD(P)-dependent dehydrogenase (short-subunit alcohol dehydrogenase family)
MQLDQVKAIITGGASGLGHAVAQHLVAHGGQVALFDVNDDKGQAAAKELGDAARFFRTDVTSEDGVATNVAAAHHAMGGLNVVMNCAGILGAGRVLGKEGPMPLGNFATTVMVNLVGSFNVAKAGAALMQGNEAGEDGERGVIINTASIAAFEGQIGQVAYTAAKAGIAGMSLTMARDLGSLGIRVNTIAPSLFATGLTKGIPDQFADVLTKDNAFPKRMGVPDEYARLAIAIIENPMLNGGTIRLDAGQRFGPK